MRVLVTGARGFVGRHVMEHLRATGHAPIGLDLPAPDGTAGADFIAGDLQQPGELEAAIRQTQPDACIHLAGIAFVPLGWTDPNRVFSVNLTGTINLLEAVRRAAPRARLLAVTSAEVYGAGHVEQPLTEEAPMRPANPYAAAKMAADLMVLLYARRYTMPAMTARPLNHIGPGQAPEFVTTAFARQLAEIAAGRSAPVIRVGNLDAQRDFTDVRDVARAYRLLIEQGRAGEAYNIVSGRPVAIRTILDHFMQIAGVSPRVEVDMKLYRPADERPLISGEKIRRETGWKPEIPLAQSLRDIYQSIGGRPAG